MLGLIILGGVLIGFSMGLTGAGGSLLAIPMLVYGLHFGVREAVGISLAAVGTTALIGALPRMRQGRIDVKAGLLVAVSGMLTAPAGAMVAGFVNEMLLLTAFATLMLVIAVHMWRSASSSPPQRSEDVPDLDHPATAASLETVPQTPKELGRKLRKRYRVLLLMLVGLTTGFLSGLFGVGGGFILVPALLLVAQMSIDRAIGTSLLCIFLVSVSGVTSLALQHRQIPFQATALFIVGGGIGLYPASRIAARVSGPKLQRIFAACIILIAVFVALKAIA